MLNNTAYNAAHGTDYAVPKLTTGTNAMVAKNRSTEALLSQDVYKRQGRQIS